MFRPLWWFLKIGGLCPERKRWDKYFTAISCSFIIISANLIVKFWFDAPHDSISSFLILVVSALFYPSGFIHVLCQSDELVPLITAQNNEPSNGTFEMVVFAFFIMYDVSRIVVYLYNFGKSPFVAILAGIGINFVNAPLIQQLVIIRHLTTKFSNLNDRLRQKSSIGDIRTYLPVLFKEHVDLRNQLAQVSSFFAVYNLLSFPSRLFYAPMSAYRVIAVVSKKGLSFSFTDLIGVIFVVLSIVIPCEVCHKCIMKANETVRIAHKLVTQDNRHSTPEDIMNQIKQFSLSVLGSPIHFTVGGVFNVDRRLITKITLMTVAIMIVSFQLKDVDTSSFAVTNTTSVTHTSRM